MGGSSPASRSDRFLPEDHDEWARTPFERDRDRVLYTRELRRLKDVTQVARAGEPYLYHDRLSHSLKVAQLGRGLAKIIKKRPRNKSIDFGKVLDENVVEAACLAHDLGHPPFGHFAEKALDEKLREKTDHERSDEKGRNELVSWAENEGENVEDLPVYGYEGNAQSFRIVTRLAAHYRSDAGLNLTHATLNAILKYLRSREEDDEKWGYYESESTRFEWARKGISAGKTLEAEIMDYADDVSYAIHDVIDFYKGGLIPLGLLLGESRRREQARQRLLENKKKNLAEEQGRDVADISVEEVEIDDKDLPGKPSLNEFETHIAKSDKMELRETTVEEFFYNLSRFPGVQDHLLTPYQGTDEESNALSRVGSNLVSRYLNADDETDPEIVYLEHANGGEFCLYIDRAFREQVWILKELTIYYVINNATLAAQQRGERQVIEELFEALYEESARKLEESAIPSPYREWLNEEPDDFEWPSPIHHRARVIADMIATMTEPQAVTFHKRLTGMTPGSLQNEIVR